jgi:hypothetical protein
MISGMLDVGGSIAAWLVFFFVLFRFQGTGTGMRRVRVRVGPKVWFDESTSVKEIL